MNLMLLIGLLAPFMFNLTGLIDTYLTQIFRKDQQEGGLHSSTGTFMIIGGIVALVFSILVGIFWYDKIFIITGSTLFYLVGSGILFGLASFPYFESLKVDKIENILPILQITPLFTYLIANIILGEGLSIVSIVLMIVIVLVTGLFSWDITTGRIHIRGLLLVLLSSFLYATSHVLFKIGGGEDTHLWVSYFWEHIGITFFCLLFLFSSSIRKSTFQYFKSNGMGFSLLNIANELLFIVGILIVNYLTLQYPVAFVNTIVNGLQPLLGFVMVYIAYNTIPSVFAREYSKKELLWKMSLCMISFVLIYWFYRVQ